MMDFDQLVRKYLSGSLTDAELYEFRDLLQRIPEYRVELKQILELRSLIHDDTLKLNPPEELSTAVRAAVSSRFAETGAESMFQRDAMSLTPPPDLSNAVRMAVAAKFAGDAIEEPEKKQRKKGLLWIPYRIVAGAFATASIAVILAISPTLFAPFGDRGLSEGRSTAGQPAITRLRTLPAPGGSNGMPGVSPSASSKDVARANGTTSADGDGLMAAVTSPIDRSTRSSIDRTGDRGEISSDRSSRSDMIGRYRPAGSVADNAFVDPLADNDSRSADPRTLRAPSNEKQEGRSMADIMAPSSRPSILDLDAVEIVGAPRGLNGTTYSVSADTANTHVMPITPAPSIASVRNEVAGEEGRRLAVGVTLGSGSVDATSPTVLMGSSCYFSFSVSGHDRVGVEMGGSTFQQDNSSREMLFGGFAKQSQGLPTDEAPEVDPVKASKQKSTPVSPTAPTAERLKQQITYGGVFYDRRVKITEQWDLCGRVTFGGADGSLVGGVRAYGSFSPTKNVSLTMGVGSSALYDLTSKKTWGSANYGIYYGVETGF